MLCSNIFLHICFWGHISSKELCVLARHIQLLHELTTGGQSILVDLSPSKKCKELVLNVLFFKYGETGTGWCWLHFVRQLVLKLWSDIRFKFCSYSLCSKSWWKSWIQLLGRRFLVRLSTRDLSKVLDLGVSQIQHWKQNHGALLRSPLTSGLSTFLAWLFHLTFVLYNITLNSGQGYLMLYIYF